VTIWTRDWSLGELENLSPVFVTLPIREASITIENGAQLRAADITFFAYAQDVAIFELLGAPAVVNSFLIGPLKDKLADLVAMPVKVLIKEAKATVTVGQNAVLEATSFIGFFVNAAADASGKAASKVVSVGYAQATATAMIDIQTGAEITAGGVVNMVAGAGATANMSSETDRDLGQVPQDRTQTAFSLAVTNARATATAKLATGASITAGMTANLRATGEVESEAEAEAGNYADGTAGLAAALEFSFADITTYVDGAITANQGPGSVVKIEIDPTAGPGKHGYVDPDTDTIWVGPVALGTGDAVTYTNRRGTSIGGVVPVDTVGGGLNPGGLVDGQTYYVISFDENRIRLAETELLAYAGRHIQLPNGPASRPRRRSTARRSTAPTSTPPRTRSRSPIPPSPASA
jgi:hypothetical protein